MTQYKLDQLSLLGKQDPPTVAAVLNEEKRKTAQFAGEGAIFFLFIVTGAVIVYRAVSRQLRTSQQQQHFMMALTHELKTPIAVAKLNLETLQKRKLDEPRQQWLLQTTLQETDRLNDLCNNMLLASQIEAGGYKVSQEEINWSQLVAEVVQEFVTRYPQRNFNADINDNLFISGDRLLVRMALNNLIENAIKYSPKNSRVTILLTEEEDQVILSVADQGKGIDDEEKKKIFHKFYRIGNGPTKNAKGTGLGLYLTEQIVRQHKGRIMITDNKPEGAVFKINFNSFNEKSTIS